MCLFNSAFSLVFCNIIIFSTIIILLWCNDVIVKKEEEVLVALVALVALELRQKSRNQAMDQKSSLGNAVTRHCMG